MSFCVEVCIHPFHEQLVLTCHSVYEPSNSEMELTDPYLADSYRETIDIVTIASATIVIVQSAVLLSPMHKLLVK